MCVSVFIGSQLQMVHVNWLFFLSKVIELADTVSLGLCVRNICSFCIPASPCDRLRKLRFC